MKKIRTSLLGLLLLIGLNNCVSNPEATQANYDRMNQQDLCMSYLYYDWMNIYQSYRAEAIRKRGIDCRPYVEMAAYKYNRDRAAWNSMYRAIDSLGTVGNTQSSSSSSTGKSLSTSITRVCYYDGMSGPSALTISAGSICPITHSHNISGMTKVCNYPYAMGGPKAMTWSTMKNCPLSYPY